MNPRTFSLTDPFASTRAGGITSRGGLASCGRYSSSRSVGEGRLVESGKAPSLAGEPVDDEPDRLHRVSPVAATGVEAVVEDDDPAWVDARQDPPGDPRGLRLKRLQRMAELAGAHI